jgi:stage V sporulation protein S
MADYHDDRTTFYSDETEDSMDETNAGETNAGETSVGKSEKAGIIKVSAKSRSTAVAGAIAAVMREHRYAEVQAIGAGAVNQAVKALAIAHGYLEGDQIDIICVPYFTEVDIEGQERTAVRFVVEPRP